MVGRFSGEIRRVAAAVALVTACVALHAEPIISEFMAANTNVLADEDGAFSDWIELHNPDDVPVDLAGWALTDTASNKFKWRLPSVTLPPGGFLIVFASNKDRADPSAPLHTNFALSASGEYLGLMRPDGTVASEFAPTFPAQPDNVSYGRVRMPNGRWETGFLREPTPGAANGGPDALRLVATVAFSRPAGMFKDSITVDLSGAIEDQVIRYVRVSGRTAALPDVTVNSPVYLGPITVSATTLVRAAVFSADGSLRGPVSTAHYVKVGSDMAEFASKLPIVVIDQLGAGDLEKDGVDHPAWAFGFTPKQTESALFTRTPDFATPLLTTVRGSSSAEFPKKGFNVKIRDALGNKRALGLFDLPAFERWALVAPWAFDQNFFNNAFVYELSNRIGRWAPRTRLVELFLNTGGDDLDAADYAGIYQITDRIRIEKGRVDIHELSSNDVSPSAITGGYILKVDAKDPDEFGWRTDRGVPAIEDSFIVLVAPDGPDVAPAQLQYIREYLQQMENALFADRAAGWRQRSHLAYLDRSSWVDHHILNALTNNPDALHRSAYFMKPRGGKLQAGPVWDFDRALGAYWDDRGNVVDTWSGKGGRIDLWSFGWWGVLAEDPEFVQEWIDRWQSLRTREFSTPALTGLAQSLANSIGTDAADRDAARWPDDASPYGSYAAQIDALKDWLTRRTEWIDSQFVTPPGVITNSGTLTFNPPPGAVLVYTLDGSDPRSLGGEQAPNALVSAETLTVPSSANIHVRSYVATAARGIPSSPWSSAIGGPNSSPLAPAARLLNLSSRASVGAGNALTFGFNVAETSAKRYLARAIGPGLRTLGVENAAADPAVTLFNAGGVELERNVGWQTSATAALLRDASQAAGGLPLVPDNADSAVLADLSSGTYTIEVTTASGQSGIALGEIYELDANGRTQSLTVRSRIAPDAPLNAGFVVHGSARKRLLIRAVGPALASSGTADAAADPVLTLYSGTTVIATNDRWSDNDNAPAIETARRRLELSALSPDSEDAAVLITVPAGNFTVEIKCKGDTGGTVLLEIHDVP